MCFSCPSRSVHLRRAPRTSANRAIIATVSAGTVRARGRSWSDEVRRSAREIPTPRRRAAPAPIVFQLGLVARPAHALATVLRASLTGFRPLAQTRQRSPEGSSPFDGSLRPDEPPDAGAARPAPGARRRQARQRQALAPAGACAREGRAIPWRQLPRMRQRSDRGMSQGGWTAVRLGRYLGLLSSQ